MHAFVTTGLALAVVGCAGNNVAPAAPATTKAPPPPVSSAHDPIPIVKGAPYWQKFVKDIHDNFSPPGNVSLATGTPVGCFHIKPDGTIVDTKLKETSDSPDLDQAAQRALDAVQKLRNDNPDPVPTELLSEVTRWICFRFDPSKT